MIRDYFRMKINDKGHAVGEEREPWQQQEKEEEEEQKHVPSRKTSVMWKRRAKGETFIPPILSPGVEITPCHT